MKLRLIGQLFLTKCIEECIINNWQVISANTDGIEVIVPKKDLDCYKKVIDDVAEQYQLIMEHEYYNKIIYKNVNNYWCITESGKIKRKGFFKLDYNEDGKREIPLGDSNNEQIISEALNAYYKSNIPIREFISNPEKYNSHIFHYCKSNKIAKNFRVIYNNETQQNLNRYYFSKNAPYLFKQKKENQYTEADRDYLTEQVIRNDGAGGLGYSPDWKPLTEEQIKQKVDNLIHGNGTWHHVNVGEGVILYNEHKEKSWEEYNINYNYYISKTQKIIDEINNLNQLTLF